MIAGHHLAPAFAIAALALLPTAPGWAQTAPATVAPPAATPERGPPLPLPLSEREERPERIVIGLSQDEVDITASFTGSEILIYGAIRRNGPVEAPGSAGIIVTVEGPSQGVTVRRKERVGPIWVNTESLRIGAAPDFYAVASSAPLDRMLSPEENLLHRISPALAVRALSGGVEVEDITPFTEALLRIRQDTGRYRSDESVQIMEDTLFRADVRLPSNLIEGDYRARIFLVRDGQVIDRNTVPIRVEKVGIERWLYRLAMQRPFWYGLMSLSIAMAAGALASAAFRMLRRG